MYQHAIEACEENSYKEDHPTVYRSLAKLAELNYVQGKYAEAARLYSRVIDINKKLLGNDDLHLVPLLRKLSDCCKKTGKDGDAEKLEKETQGILDKHFLR